MDNQQKFEFITEKVKERPINKKKLIRKTLVTVSMAAIFGIIACLTFALLEPIISNWLHPEEKIEKIDASVAHDTTVYAKWEKKTNKLQPLPYDRG